MCNKMVQLQQMIIHGSIIKLDDTSIAILNEVLDGIEVVSEIIPFAQLFIKTCKNIRSMPRTGRLRAEVQIFYIF